MRNSMFSSLAWVGRSFVPGQRFEVSVDPIAFVVNQGCARTGRSIERRQAEVILPVRAASDIVAPAFGKLHGDRRAYRNGNEQTYLDFHHEPAAADQRTAVRHIFDGKTDGD